MKQYLITNSCLGSGCMATQYKVDQSYPDEHERYRQPAAEQTYNLTTKRVDRNSPESVPDDQRNETPEQKLLNWHVDNSRARCNYRANIRVKKGNEHHLWPLQN